MRAAVTASARCLEHVAFGQLPVHSVDELVRLAIGAEPDTLEIVNR